MMEQKPNPMHLASWAIGGAVIAVSAWFFSFLPIPRFHSTGCGFWAMMWMNRSRIIAFSGPLLVGLPISVWAERRFNEGVRDETWSEAELAPVLSLVVKPIWSWGSWMILVACVLSSVLWEHRDGGSFVYILLYPLQLATRMRQLLTPKPRPNGGLLDLQNFKPIRSEHWGEPALRTEDVPT